MYVITDGLTAIEDVIVLNFDTTRRSRTIVHEVLGSGTPDVTLRPLESRSGTLSLYSLTRATTTALEEMHRTGLAITLSESGVPAMRYVVSGGVRVNFLPEISRWTVDIDYREVI